MDTPPEAGNDEPLPFVINAVRSEGTENGHSDKLERLRFSGMILPIAPPEGDEGSENGKESTPTPSGVTAVKPSRKVARKSTAKAAKNLVQQQEVETNNNELKKDTDLEVKTKQAARRLQEKLRLLSSFSKQPDRGNEAVKESEEILTKNSEDVTKIKLKVTKTKVGVEAAVAAEISSDADNHQGDMDVSPPSAQNKNILQTQVTEFKSIPQYSSTPNTDRKETKRKRSGDISPDSNQSQTPDQPQKKVLRSRSSSVGGSPNSSFDAGLSNCQKAFLYDGIDECTPCSVKFLNVNSLKKHLRNGHRVMLIREIDMKECTLEILNRDQLTDFIQNVRPNVCRYCGMKYKYLSCVFKHERSCMSKPSEDPGREEPKQRRTTERGTSAKALEKCMEEYVGNGAKKYHCLICSLAVGDRASFLKHFANAHENNDNSKEVAKRPVVRSRKFAKRQQNQTLDAGPEIDRSTYGSFHKGFNYAPDAVPPISQGFKKVFRADGVFTWKCLVCEMKLSHKSNLKRHYGRHTEYFYKCQNCGLRMKTIKEYRNHKFTCYSKPARQPISLVKPRVVSSKVQKPVVRIGGIFAKKFEKTNIGPKDGIKKINIGGTTQWKCTICQKKVKYKSTMEKHYICHFNGRKEYFCKYCNHKSMDEPSHNVHEADCWTVSPPDGIQILMPTEAQQGNGSYKCSICHRVFWHVYNYKRHAMKHSGLGAFKCDRCGSRYKSFKDRDNCCRNRNAMFVDGSDTTEQNEQHSMQSDNAAEENDPYRFDDGKEVEKSGKLAKKRKTSLPSTPVTNIASSKSVKKRKSAMDGLTHGDVMKWARTLLAQSKKPNKKSKNHLSLKSFKCPICKKSFTSKSYLRTHLMYHARGPPEDCPYCGKSFIYHSYREKHIETCKQGASADDDDDTEIEEEIQDAHGSEAAAGPIDAAPEAEEASGGVENNEEDAGTVAEPVDFVEEPKSKGEPQVDDVTQAHDQKLADDQERPVGTKQLKRAIAHDQKVSGDQERPVAINQAKKANAHDQKLAGDQERPVAINQAKKANTHDQKLAGDQEPATKEPGDEKAQSDDAQDQKLSDDQEKPDATEKPKKEKPPDDVHDLKLSDDQANPVAAKKSRTEKMEHDDDDNNNNEEIKSEVNLVKKKETSKDFERRDMQGKGYARINVNDKWMYECNMCKRLFREHEEVVMHVKIHQKNSFLCNMCAKTFPTWMQFQRHQLMLHGVRPIEEIESDAESDIIISDSGSDSDEEMYIDMEDDMKPPEVQEIEDIKPVLLKNIKRSSIRRSEESQMPKMEDEEEEQGGEEYEDDQQEDNASDYTLRDDNTPAQKKPIGKTKTKAKKRFQCDFCHKMLACASALYRHRLGHFGPATYRCDDCNIGFVTPKDRNQHNLDFHGFPKPIYGGTPSKFSKIQPPESIVSSEKTEVNSQNSQVRDKFDDVDGPNSEISSLSSTRNRDHYRHSSSPVSTVQALKERDTHSPALTDSSEGSQSSKKSKGYICPGCHKIIKSETTLYSHMNLCIPDQPGSVYKCFRCSDCFIFRAAHIIHEFSCQGKSSAKSSKPDEDQAEEPKSLRKRSISIATSETPGVTSGTPPIGSMTEPPSFGVSEPYLDLPSSEDKGLSYASDSSSNRTPQKDNSLAYLNKAARGVQSLYCFECNKELKAWSLHKHVSQCCPSKVSMFHTCDLCGHSTKTYAGYMIHSQLGCDPVRQAGVHRKPTTGLSLSPGDNDVGYDNSEGPEMIPAFQELEARSIGSMEILSPSGQPIKVEIDYDFNEAYPSYSNSHIDDNTPSGMSANQKLTSPVGSTEERRRTYVCQHCNKEYRSHSGLDHHKKKCTGQQNASAKEDASTPKGMSLKVNLPNQPATGYRCQFCGDTFFHAALLHVHEASHSAKLPLNATASLGTLIPQSMDESSQAPIETQNVKILSCNICGKEFINKQRLQRHERIHLNVKPFKCKLCSRSFGRRDNLRQHEFLVHKIKKNASDEDIDPHSLSAAYREQDRGQDSEGFEESSEKSKGMAEDYSHEEDAMDFSLAQNEMNAQGEVAEGDEETGGYEDADDMEAFTVKQQFQCRLCPITCENLSAIKKHMLTHTDDRPHKCDICGLSFKQMGNLNRHRLTHEGAENSKSYVCPYCDKCYSQKLSLQSHILTHTGERPFQCKFCSKTFGREQVLRNHEKTHMEKAYECDICLKKFARNDAMKVHRLHHLNDNQKPHRCDLCERGFVTRQQLTDHRRSHTNERPYPCRYCKKSFTTAGGRGLHERLHNAKVINYCCPTCKVIMHNYGSYKKHVSTCQGSNPNQSV